MNCPTCGQGIEFPVGSAGEAFNCPSCRTHIFAAPSQTAGRIERVNSGSVAAIILRIIGFLVWLPCLIICVGVFSVADKDDIGAALMLTVPSAIGFVFGVLIFFWGQKLAEKSVCSECGNRVDGTDVKMCPTCRVSLRS